MMSIAKKQYVISSYKLCLKQMREINVGRRFLYIHDQLNICIIEALNGEKIIVLGNAYCVDVSDKSIIDDIKMWDGRDVCKLTRYWTGRWILIRDSELITDATGLMSAFYTSSGYKWIITSSLALMAETLKVNVEREVKETGISWQIVPGTLLDKVFKLTSTEKIIFSNTGIQITPYIWIQDRRNETTDQKSTDIAKMLVNGVTNINNYSGKKIMQALTSGKDSRLVFAALIRSGVDFSTYTAKHRNISTGDKCLPVKISQDFKIPHLYIQRKQISEKRLIDYRVFTAKNSLGEDTRFYASGQFEEIMNEAIVLRSGLFEAGQNYARSIARNTKISFETDMQQYYTDLRNDEYQRKYFERWLNEIDRKSVGFVDIRDLFYVEQRVGGWVAAIEQSLDMNEFTSIQIANCAEILSVLLSANIEERSNLSLTFETIKKLQPELLQYPINPKFISDKLRYFKNILLNPKKKLNNFINKLNKKFLAK